VSIILWGIVFFVNTEGNFLLFRQYPAESNIMCMSTADFRLTEEMIKRQPVPLPPRDEKIREDFLNFHYAGML
jgi:hypothetical protein